MGFKSIGELINEDKFILSDEESRGMSVKDHYPQEDGIAARLLATEAGSSQRACCWLKIAGLYKHMDRFEYGRIGASQTSGSATIFLRN